MTMLPGMKMTLLSAFSVTLLAAPEPVALIVLLMMRLEVMAGASE